MSEEHSSDSEKADQDQQSPSIAAAPATSASSAETIDPAQEIISEVNSYIERYAQQESHPDDRSVFIGNVDYGSSKEELGAHFQNCGEIKRVTILQESHTLRPRGFAYIEFSTMEEARNALMLHGSKFRNRELKKTLKRLIREREYEKVLAKRPNVPNLGRGRGYFPGARAPRTFGYPPMPRGRGRGGRGGGFSPYTPYYPGAYM